MQRYLLGVGVLLLVVAVFYFGGNMGSDVAPTTQAVNFAREGTIVKDYPDLKQGTWYLLFEEEGETYAAELVFDEDSICGSAAASGVCKPSVFIEGRSAVIEGELINDASAVYVMRLFFAPRQQTE